MPRGGNTRRRRVNRRPTYAQAVEWLAHEDNAGAGDSVEEISSYVTTHLVADLFGAETTRDVAEDVARERRKAGLDVGEDSE
jgi:hypothetical protein